jgi:hypothetical protein
MMRRLRFAWRVWRDGERFVEQLLADPWKEWR